MSNNSSRRSSRTLSSWAAGAASLTSEPSSSSSSSSITGAPPPSSSSSSPSTATRTATPPRQKKYTVHNLGKRSSKKKKKKHRPHHHQQQQQQQQPQLGLRGNTATRSGPGSAAAGGPFRVGGSKKQHRGSLNHASLESGASDPAAKIRRWSTLPNVFKRGGLGAAVAAGGGGGVAGASSGAGVDDGSAGANGHGGAGVGVAEAVMQQRMNKNEVDLSIAALESLLEDLDTPAHSVLSASASASSIASAADPSNQMYDKLLNVVFLLKKFQVDSAVSATIREMQVKRFVNHHFVEHPSELGTTEDEEVARWISENVFAPSELRHMRRSGLATTNNGSALDLVTNASSFAAAGHYSSDTMVNEAGLAVGGVDGSATLPSAIEPSPRRRTGPRWGRTLRADTSMAGNRPSLTLAARARRGRIRRSSMPNVLYTSTAKPAAFSDQLTASPSPNSAGSDALSSSSGSRRASTEADETSVEGKPAPPVEGALTASMVMAAVDVRMLSNPVVQVLGRSDQWSFDVFELVSLVPDRPLLVLMTHFFRSMGIFERFNISRRKFTTFMSRIESTYVPGNPYHNNVHGTDVAQAVRVFLGKPSMAQKISALDVVAALIAAAVHDVGHPGTNNQFHIATQSDLAIRYNDRSVLENFHVAETFRIMRDPECDLFESLSSAQRNELRESMIVQVLATDMQAHVQLLSETESLLAGEFSKSEASGIAAKAASTSTPGSASALVSPDASHEPAPVDWFDRNSRHHVLLCLRMSLHCADVSNPTRPIVTYKPWVRRVVEEFFQQGDKERALGLPVSPLMDRQKPNVPRSQLGFIDFFIRPLYETWVKIVPELAAEVMSNLEANRAYFASLAAAELKELPADEDDSADRDSAPVSS